jgi:hypothetical protein
LKNVAAWEKSKLEAHQTLEEKHEAYVLKKVHAFLDEENIKREDGQWGWLPLFRIFKATRLETAPL